jgi:hypothetical protein
LLWLRLWLWFRRGVAAFLLGLSLSCLGRAEKLR